MRSNPERDLRSILDSIPDGAVLTNFEGRIIEVNSSIEDLLGIPRDSLYNRKFSEFYTSPPDRIGNGRIEVSIRSIDGRIIECLETDRTFHFNGFDGYLIIIQDISEERRREKSIERFKKLLKIGGEISKLVVVEKDRRELLRRMCKILTELGDNIKVSIGVIQEDQIELSTNTYSTEESILLSEKEFPCLQSLKRNYRFFRIKRQTCETCNRAEKLYETNLVLPIIHEEHVFGYLWFYLREDIFSKEELEFIKDLVSDLGVALMSIKIEERRKEALDRIKENLEYFEFLSDKLRNPVAIIKGIIDIKDDIGLKKTVEVTSQQIDRIIEILNDLRIKEEETFCLREKLTRG